jgi:hypothetical protein
MSTQVERNHQSPVSAPHQKYEGYDDQSDENSPEQNQKILIRLAGEIGYVFINVMGHHRGIKAIKFDFKGRGFPQIIPEIDNFHTPVLWSRQVAWAIEKSADSTKLSSEQLQEVAMIIKFQRQLETCGAPKLLPPEGS